MLGKQRSGSSGQQPGSRRELPNEKEAVKGVSSGNTRPGTAPQNLNGLLSNGQQQQSKSQRPMSPFTKVYSTSAHGVRTSVSQKNRGGLAKQGQAGAGGPGMVTNLKIGGQQNIGMRKQSPGQNFYP